MLFRPAHRRVHQITRASGLARGHRGSARPGIAFAGTIERKLQHYAANQRFIVNYELSQTEDDIDLFVVSTLTPVR